ncbi:MAG: hypothetical protein RR064_03710, partial [Oscillospiraceae bacterium]
GTTTDTSIIEEEQVALGAEPKSGWALINLILTFVTAIAAISIIVPLFRKKKDDDKKDDSDDEEEEKEYKNRTKMRLLSIIPMIASIIAFVLTENIFTPMFFVDKWTILMAVIALVQLVIYLFVRRDNDEKEQEEETAR